MKNITAQYRDLLEGKMTKANFMANVRMQFPDYISPVNSYEDMVKILKSKRILSETREEKTFYLVDDGVAVDETKAMDLEAAKKHFYGMYGGEMKSWIVTDVHPSSLDETDTDIEALQAGALKEDNTDPYIMGLDANRDRKSHTECPFEKGTPEADLWMSGWMDHETAKQMSHDEDTYNRETGGYGDLYKESLDEYGDEDDIRDPELFKTKNQFTPTTLINNLLKQGIDKWGSIDDMVKFVQKIYPDMDSDKILDAINAHKEAGSPTFDFKDDDLPFFEGKKSLKEATEKPEGSYKKVTGKDLYSFFNEIDRVNPYEVKKGIAIEMGMQYQPVPNYFTDDFNPESLAKATRKVLKNLQKDPAYYTNMISLPTEKRTNMLQKPAEVKVKADGHTKIKGFTDAKGNTEENLGKKERAKGSPEGVKEMKPSKKSMGGLKTMKSNDKLPKGVELMKEADLTNSPAGLNAIGTSDLAARAKEIYAQEEFDRLMQRYDWYYEMSDSPRVNDRGVALDNKLKELAKVIGAEKALEIFNKYAPANRKAKPEFFAETVDMKSKLKELVMQEVKKRLSEKRAIVVSKTATSQQIDQMAQKNPAIKPGEELDIIRK